MKTIQFLFLFYFGLLSLNLSAQSESSEESLYHRFYFGISKSEPINEFSESYDDDQESGFANEGSRLTFGYHYNFGKNQFLTFEYSNANYSVDYDDILQNLRINNNTGSKFSIGQEKYVVHSFTFGFKYAFPVNKFMSIYLNPFIGLGDMKIGDREYIIRDSNDKIFLEEFQRDGSASTTSIFGANAGLNFKITQAINLNFFVSYSKSSFEIEAEFYRNAHNPFFNTIYTEKISYTQPYEVTNLGFLLGYNF